jgi:AcrR family transcriptional regulator
MTKMLTALNWIDFALTTLAHEGFDALKADVLARKLAVSRGSFYWHFRDLRTFHARIIEHWREMATEAIIADLERYDAAEKRLNALLHHAFGRNAVLEVRMRAWGDNNADAARAIRDIDRRRRQYIEQLLIEAGIPEAMAATRAELVYWTYLGAALSRSKLTGERRDRIVAELKLVALRNPSEKA